MTPAIRTLERLGVEFTVHEFDHADGARDYGHEAGDALGVDPARVFKTLVVTVAGRQRIAIVPVTSQLALKAAAAAFGEKRAEMCDPQAAQRITGYVVGGISPFGQRKRLDTVVDASATDFDTIYVSGGKRGLDIELSPKVLIDALSATTAPIAAA